MSTMREIFNQQEVVIYGDIEGKVLSVESHGIVFYLTHNSGWTGYSHHKVGDITYIPYHHLYGMKLKKPTNQAALKAIHGKS